jgi:hypothetical protein
MRHTINVTLLGLSLVLGSSPLIAEEILPMSPKVQKTQVDTKLAGVCKPCSRSYVPHDTYRAPGGRCRVSVRRPPVSKKANGEPRVAGSWCFHDIKTGEGFSCNAGTFVCTKDVVCGAILEYCQNYTSIRWRTGPSSGGKVYFKPSGRCVPKKSDHPKGVDWKKHQT